MDCDLRNSAELREIKIEEIEKLLGLTGCRVDRINRLIIIMDCELGTQLNGEKYK